MTVRLLASLCALCALRGETYAAPPTIESLSPGVGQRGTEFTVTFTGARLTDPRELMLYAPGVTCTKLAAKDENTVAVTLKAAADCKLGEHAFRLRTPGGLSELRTLTVTPLPVVLEVEPNDEKPQAVPLNVSVAGVIESAGVDNYAVTLKKGQRLSAEVEAMRLGADVTDTVLAVFGPEGKALATVDDTPLFRQDPFVSLVAPADGVYVVQVRETNYGGGDTNRYVLHVGDFARPAAVFPAGGQAGTDVNVKLLGDAGETTQAVKLPPAGTPFEFFPGGAPTPNPFRVSNFPNVIEGDAKVAAWPIAFNGIITKPGEADTFRFRAAKGDEIDVQAFAFRVGSPLDSVVAVLDSTGAVVAANDDDETHDSRVRVNIPADGEYVVRVTDKRNQGGPRFIYRVELDKPKPSLAVFVAPPARKTQDRQVIAVPRGNRVTAYLGVRRDGVAGPVKLTASELPAGVKAAINPVGENEYLVPVVFEAAADAPVGGKLVALTGECGGVTGGFSQVVRLVSGPGDSALHDIELNRLAVVVVEDVPYSVQVVPPTTPLTADGTLDVVVKVARAKDFAEPLEVKFPCLPPGVETTTSVILPADKSEAVVTLVASEAADAGDWKLVMEVQVARAGRGSRDALSVGMNGLGTPPPAGGGRRPRRKAVDGLPPVATELVGIKVTDPPAKGTFAPAAGEQGKTVKVVCNLDAAPPAGDFTAKLDGLPPRAAAKPVSVKAGAKAVEFEVSIDPTTPPGTHPSLVCELSGKVGGQSVVYRLGRGGVLKVDVPGAVKTDATGKPLSPLDALRLEQKKK